MTRLDYSTCIEEHKLIAIVRGIETKDIVPTMEALYRGGIRLAEITFDASGKTTDEETEEKIRLAADAMDGRMLIGAGTVTMPSQAERTKRAGGVFIISPDVNVSVIRRTRALGMVSIPGALTPTEIRTANAAGADFVKVFPAGCFGVTYFKALRAPLSDIRMMAVGNINTDNLREYLAAGAVGFGISSGIVRRDLISAGKFDEITALAERYTALLAE